jgi:hypothetical protein
MLHESSGNRENDVSLKVKDTGKINFCWQKLDRKTKKLTFNFRATDVD